MASVRKRGDTYQITVSNGRKSDGSQIIETATYTPEPGMTQKQIKKALETFAIDFERSIKSGKNIKGRRMTLSDLAKLYLEDMKPPTGESDGEYLAFTSWVGYKNNLENRILPRIGHIKIGEIIPKTLNDYAKEMRKDGSRLDGKSGGYSEATIYKDRCLVSSMLSYAVGEGLLEVNPILYAGRQRKPQKARKEYQVEYFTIEQTKWFLWALDNPIQIRHEAHYRTNKNGTRYLVPEYTQTWSLPLMWRAYFYLALFIGDRRGENISFTWEDIDLLSGEVRITKSTAYANRQIIHKDTKTHSSRTPIVPPIVTNILKQWKKEQMEMSLKLGTYWQGYRGKEFDKNYIFIQDNGKQIHPSSPYHKFKKIVRIYNENVAADDEHKIPANATQHHLRHTAASILIANGMDARSVAGILGHANPTTTLNIYSYFFKSKNQEAANIMENVLTNNFS